MAKKQAPVNDFQYIIPNKKAILKQYIREKDYAIKVRQTKINNWIKNEEAYNGVTFKTLLTRSNLHLPIVFEGVQNMSSKIGKAPDVEYDTIPEGDENASEIMEHVIREDLDASNWDIIYDQSKIEGGIYGRSIYKVIPGNDRQRVELIDTMSYLISPIAKNTKDALYQGQQFIYKTIEQLEEEKDKMEYDQEELDKLKQNKVLTETVTDSTTEASLKNLRLANMGLANTTQYGSKVAELTEWWTYLSNKGETESELYVLTVANDIYLLRCQKASDIGLKRPPFISWGAFTRGITFWCPSVADVYRDPNLAMDVSMNQVIDNSTYRNFGMSFVSSSSGLKQSSIVPRPLGLTSVTVAPGQSIKDHIYTPEVPEITTGLTIMQVIKGFADQAAGMAPNAPAHKGKLSVTQQAKLNADLEAKIVVIKRNSTLACQELYQLMADITKDKLTKPRPVKIFGYKNITLEDVTKKNFGDVEFVAKAVPSEESEQNKGMKQKAKIEFYQLFKDDPKIPGQTALRRSVAKTFDIPPDEIESYFTEEVPNPAMVAVETGKPAGDGQIPPKSNIAPANPISSAEVAPLIKQTQTNAQNLVPAQIK